VPALEWRDVCVDHSHLSLAGLAVVNATDRTAGSLRYFSVTPSLRDKDLPSQSLLRGESKSLTYKGVSG